MYRFGKYYLSSEGFLLLLLLLLFFFYLEETAFGDVFVKYALPVNTEIAMYYWVSKSSSQKTQLKAESLIICIQLNVNGTTLFKIISSLYMITKKNNLFFVHTIK